MCLAILTVRWQRQKSAMEAAELQTDSDTDTEEEGKREDELHPRQGPRFGLGNLFHRRRTLLRKPGPEAKLMSVFEEEDEDENGMDDTLRSLRKSSKLRQIRTLRTE